jgi:poly-gamma-glutamate capsule biosynthesis protein CapA/YwtB (metallophosphatase superfamily)
MYMKSYLLQLINIFVLVTLLSCTIGGSEFVTQKAIKDSVIAEQKDTIVITAVGDMMLGSAYPDKSGLPPDDAISSFDKVKRHLKGDVVFGNLEGCFLDSGKSVKCKDTIGNTCFAFRMPERYAKIYKNAGFNLLSLANNHVGDFGSKGRRRTKAILDSLQINYAGLTTAPYCLFERDSIKYAFCAFSPNEGTLSITAVDSAKSLVNQLKQMADLVIVSFHGGGEGAQFERITRKTELFYKEDRGNVYEFAHAVIDAGADVVIGHGPHVIRAAEVYKNKFIIYSLGNFCTYGKFNLTGPNRIAPILQIRVNRQGNFTNATVISVKQSKSNGLSLDRNDSATKKLALLTKLDFPNSKLKFTMNNLILNEAN